MLSSLAATVGLLTSFLDVIKGVEQRNAASANRLITDQECFAEQKLLEKEFETFEKSILVEVEKQKAESDQDLVNRGMYNSTIRDAANRRIEQDAITMIERAHDSMRNAIEKLEFHKARRE